MYFTDTLVVVSTLLTPQYPTGHDPEPVQSTLHYHNSYFHINFKITLLSFLYQYVAHFEVGFLPRFCMYFLFLITEVHVQHIVTSFDNSNTHAHARARARAHTHTHTHTHHLSWVYIVSLKFCFKTLQNRVLLSE
jgi:hypothetical protein